jgi:hypothetical protein
MEKDFEVGQSNELIRQGTVHDLHNLYDFAWITIDDDSRVRISFVPNAQHGKGQRPIVLEFDGIDYLELSANFGVRQISLLEEMGYKSPEDHDHEWLMSERQATMRDHLFFRLGSEDFIRIHSQRARLREGNVLE